MKNIIVCNLIDSKEFKNQEKYFKAQIDNSLNFGWDPKDIIFAANFDYTYKGVKTIICKFNCSYCSTGSKTFAIRELFKKGLMSDENWVHDLDAWQLAQFSFPHIKDIGMVRYIGRWNGGSVFIKPEAKDIIDAIASEIEKTQSNKEEPIIKKIFRIKQYKDRITALNQTYNVGATGFEKRYIICDKPVKVVHMHPTRTMDCNRNIGGMNRIGARLIGEDVLDLFKSYFADKENNLNFIGNSACIQVSTNPKIKYQIASLRTNEPFNLNRKYKFTYIPDCLQGREFIKFNHKQIAQITITAKTEGVFEIALSDQHPLPRLLKKVKQFYHLEHIPIKTDYRDGKIMRIYRGFLHKGEQLHLNHKWRVNPIPIAKTITFGD